MKTLVFQVVLNPFWDMTGDHGVDKFRIERMHFWSVHVLGLGNFV